MKGSNPGTLAHELGHVPHARSPWILKARQYSKHLPYAGALASSFSNDERFSKGVATAATAAGSIPLMTELDASMRGHRLMKAHAPMGGGRWRAYTGLPTYALKAALPFLAHYGKKGLGGFDRPQGKITDR